MAVETISVDQTVNLEPITFSPEDDFTLFGMRKDESGNYVSPGNAPKAILKEAIGAADKTATEQAIANEVQARQDADSALAEAVNSKAPVDTTYTKEEVDTAVADAISALVATLDNRPPSIGSPFFQTQEDDTPMSRWAGTTWVALSETAAGKVIQLPDANKPVGQIVEAGLPNIEGSTDLKDEISGSVWNSNGVANSGENSGAITYKDIGAYYRFSRLTTQNSFRGIKIDASLSNPIYGASDTVQPPAFIIDVWIRTA